VSGQVKGLIHSCNLSVLNRIHSELSGRKSATLTQHTCNLTCTHCLSARATYQRFDSWPDDLIFVNFSVFMCQLRLENNSTTNAFSESLKNESKLFAVRS